MAFFAVAAAGECRKRTARDADLDENEPNTRNVNSTSEGSSPQAPHAMNSENSYGRADQTNNDGSVLLSKDIPVPPQIIELSDEGLACSFLVALRAEALCSLDQAKIGAKLKQRSISLGRHETVLILLFPKELEITEEAKREVTEICEIGDDAILDIRPLDKVDLIAWGWYRRPTVLDFDEAADLLKNAEEALGNDELRPKLTAAIAKASTEIVRISACLAHCGSPYVPAAGNLKDVDKFLEEVTQKTTRFKNTIRDRDADHQPVSVRVLFVLRPSLDEVRERMGKPVLLGSKEHATGEDEILNERCRAWMHANQHECINWLTDNPDHMIVYLAKKYTADWVVPLVLAEAARHGRYVESDYHPCSAFALSYARLFGNVGRKRASECLMFYNDWAKTALDLETVDPTDVEMFAYDPVIFERAVANGAWSTWVVQFKEKPDEATWEKSVANDKMMVYAGLLFREGIYYMVFLTQQMYEMSSAKSLFQKHKALALDLASLHHLDQLDVEIFGPARIADFWTVAGPVVVAHYGNPRGKERKMLWLKRHINVNLMMATPETVLALLPRFAELYSKLCPEDGRAREDKAKKEEMKRDFQSFLHMTDPSITMPKLDGSTEKAVEMAMNLGLYKKNGPCAQCRGPAQRELGLRRLLDGAAVDFCSELCRLRFDRVHLLCLMTDCGSTEFQTFEVHDPLSLRPGGGPPRRLSGWRCAKCKATFSQGRESGRLLSQGRLLAQDDAAAQH
jgi:hypothetical protein